MTRNLTRRPSLFPAFTLIELLVVVSIIAILIGLMIPALSRSRDAAKTAISTSNARQIALGMYLYASENKGYFPGTAHIGVTWMEQIGLPAFQTLADFGGDVAAYDDYLARVKTCTKFVEDPKAFVSPKDDSPFILPTAATRRWTSYGLNGYFTYDHPPYYGIKIDSVNVPSRTILISEFRNEDEGATDPWEDHFVPQFANDGTNYVSGTANIGPYNPGNPVPIAAFPYPQTLGVLSQGPSFAGTIDFTEDAEASWSTAEMRPNSTYEATRYGGKWLHGFADGHAATAELKDLFQWGNTGAKPTMNGFDPKGVK